MSQRRTLQKTTQKRAPRKCSVCGKNGHNARTCDTVSLQQMQALKKKKTSSRFVAVQVTTEAKPSPHIVQLTREKSRSHWDGIEVYRDNKSTEKRQVVDFASMIRTSKKQEYVKKSLPVEEVKIDILEEISKIKSQPIPKVQPKIRKHISFTHIVHRVHVGISDMFDNARRGVITRMTAIHDHFSFKRFAISTLVLFIIVSLPFPAVGYYKKVQDDTARVVEQSTNAFLSLQSSTVATFQNNLPQAQYDLTSALNAFGSAEEIVDKEYKALVSVAELLPVLGDKVKSRHEVLLAGHHIALGNAYFIKGIEAATAKDDMSLIQRLSVVRQYVQITLPQYRQAQESLEKIEITSLPVEYQESFDEFRTLFSGVISDMEHMSDVVRGIQLIMGGDGFKRYLVLFQNQYELRASGGFVGSFATIDVQNGKVLNIDVPGGGSYDLQGQLDVFLKPPVPLQLVNKRWEFQDGNWFFDFPTTAQKMAWFYRHGRDTTVDGVIAINASVLERLLRVVGPLTNEEYDLVLDSEHALEDLQYEIETYDKEDNTPKAILSVLLDQMLANIGEVSPEKIVSLITELYDACNEKEIQFYFTDDHVQKTFAQYGWTGEVMSTSEHQDYLAVVHTNLGGGKSDAKIDQDIYHEAVVQEDGSIIDTVLVTRYHEGLGDERFFDTHNISYVRVYVPEGSELVDAGGFIYPDEASFLVPETWYTEDDTLQQVENEQSVHVNTGTRITNEFGKTVFGNWIVTGPSQETTVFFTYKLPFTIFDIVEDTSGTLAQLLPSSHEDDISRYSILFQKQSGTNSSLSHTVIYPDHWRPVWRANDDMTLSINGAKMQTVLDTNKISGVVMKRK